MESRIVLAVIIFYIASVGESVSNAVIASEFDHNCGVRFEDNGVCVCSKSVQDGAVQCHSNNTIAIRPCYCLYYDEKLNSSIVGHCLFTCYSNMRIKITNTTNINHEICKVHSISSGKHTHSKHINRNGRFCGSCNKDHGLAVYSYHYISCVKCKNYSYKNWLKYFIIALLPLTIFYILALLLKINVTSSSFSGLVVICQCSTIPVYMIVLEGQMALKYLTSVQSISVKIIITLLCTTNLDFFRLFYSPFCLHPNFNILHIMSLDYIVALYPFLLILITYVLVTLYDRNYRLLVWIWKPFKWCIYHYSKHWNIRTSLIETFATFILLSYIKILGVSLHLLLMTRTFNINLKAMKKNYLLLDASIEYFGSEHLPFAVLAIFVITVFVLLPFLLLLLYPCRCFQRCLNYFGLRCQALHILMDAFQGSYRIEPHDYRYFSAFYLLLRMLVMVQVQIFTSAFLFYTSAMITLLFAVVLAAFQPYKVSAHNYRDSILLVFLGGYFASYGTSEFLTLLGYYSEVSIVLGFTSLFAISLALYFTLVIASKLFGSQVKSMIRKTRRTWSTLCDHKHTESLPAIESFDRDVNESQRNYPPLLGPQQDHTY